MNRADQLQQAFAVPTSPDRAAALTGVLPPRPVGAPSSAPGSPPSGTGPEERNGAKPGLRGVAVYLPPDLAAWLRSTAAECEQTYSDVVLAAFETQAGDLPATLDSGAALDPGRSTLFPPRPTRRRTTPKAKVQVQLRLTGDELAVIDRLVAQHQAPSRTALVVRVLAAEASAP